MIDYTKLPEAPGLSAEDSYDVFCQLFPQRSAPWEELAEWERGRWRLIASAAVTGAGRQAP